MKDEPPPNCLQPSDDAPYLWVRDRALGRALARDVRGLATRRRRRWAGAVAGTVLMGGVALMGVRFAGEGAGGAEGAGGPVRVVAPARQALPDGSLVELNRGAVIAVQFSAALRQVHLTQGEAHFAVAKDEARPFVVVAGGVEVRAVGTAFAVAQGDDEVEVIVTEGSVAVARANGEAADAARGVAPVSGGREPPLAEFAAGSRLHVAGGPATAVAVSRVTPDEVARRLAWRVPRLELESAPLEEVVRLFAAHGRVRLVLAEDDLRRVQVSGVLRADNTEALLRLLAADHGIQAEARGVEIVLRRRR